jgi:hypothetical protein
VLQGGQQSALGADVGQSRQPQRLRLLLAQVEAPGLALPIEQHDVGRRCGDHPRLTGGQATDDLPGSIDHRRRATRGEMHHPAAAAVDDPHRAVRADDHVEWLDALERGEAGDGGALAQPGHRVDAVQAAVDARLQALQRGA